MKPELGTQEPHGAPSSGPGCPEHPAGTSFPVVMDRCPHGLLFSAKWGEVIIMKKCGLLSKDFQNLGSLVARSLGGKGGDQRGARQAGIRVMGSQGSVPSYCGLGLPALLSSLVVSIKDG